MQNQAFTARADDRSMSSVVDRPLRFTPLFHERVWGGRRLEGLFGKALPEGAVVGESWELVDRPEAQSVVADGPLAGATLHELWDGPRRAELFGTRAGNAGERFPLLVKLLDCEDTLSVQVHPPAELAPALGGEPKTEMWVLLGDDPGAHVFAGLAGGVTRQGFEAALRAGADVSAQLQRIDVTRGDVVFIPSGRVHAIGAGCVIAEIQQNSDTTYRVYDFDRPGLDGRPRELHVEESLRSIDFGDAEPGLAEPDGELLVGNDLFVVERLVLDGPRVAADPGELAVLCLTSGEATCAGEPLEPGQFVLVPACASDASLEPSAAGPPAELLRIALPA